jgi:hypothetical protein
MLPASCQRDIAKVLQNCHKEVSVKIAFLGDLHGRVFHALALLTTWQEKIGKMLDTVIQVGGVGSVLPGGEKDVQHDSVAYERLLQIGEGAFDILVAHDTPYGTGIGYWGQLFGSQEVSKLMEVVQPQYLVAGHAHQMRGPNNYGKTVYIGLSIIIKARRFDPRRTVQPGSMAVYDTEARRLEFVMDDWLADFHGDIDFVAFVEAFSSHTSAS